MPHRWTDAPFTNTAHRERRRWRLSYVTANAFEMWLAAAAVATGLLFLIDPSQLDDTSVARANIGVVWNIAYLVGGALVMFGLIKPTPRGEIAGLSILSASIIGNAIAILALNGTTGLPAALTQVGIAAACASRTYLVMRLMRVGGRLR